MPNIELGDVVDFIALTALVGSFFVWASKRWASERRVAYYLRLIHVAKYCSEDLLFTWMKRGARRATRLLAQIYGIRNSNKSALHKGYLSERSFMVSTQLATIYLTIGAVIALGAMIVFANAKPLSDRFFGVALLIGSGLALVRMWKKKNRLVQRDADQFGAIISAALLCVGVPISLQLLQPSQFNGSMLRAAERDSEVGVWIFPFIFILFVSIQKGLASINRAYTYRLPMGLLLFVLVSAPVSITVFDVTNFLSGRSGGWTGVILIVVLVIRGFFYSRISVRVVKTSLTISAIACLVYFTIRPIPLFELPLAEIYRLLTDAENGGIPIIAQPFMMGVMIAIIASLAYANALCDWISVATTRRLLSALARTKKFLNYGVFLLLDIVLALLLVAGTYILFSALTHVFLLAFPVPTDEFLSGLRSVIFERSLGPISYVEEERFMYDFGRGLAKFVGFFALTAVIPTIFHLTILLFVLVGRIILIMGSIPAKEMMRNVGGVEDEMPAAPSDSAIDAVIRIGGITTFAVGFLIYKVVTL